MTPHGLPFSGGDARTARKDLLEKRFPFSDDRIDFDNFARDLRARANHLLYPQLADVAWQ